MAKAKLKMDTEYEEVILLNDKTLQFISDGYIVDIEACDLLKDYEKKERNVLEKEVNRISQDESKRA